VRAHSSFNTHRRSRLGFTLVEIMVAMVIGMLGIIVMMQLFTVTEGQKRSTTSSGDAQSTGAIALYGLQREIKQAGYGFADVSILGCDLDLRAGVSLPNFAPIIINSPLLPAGDPNTDTLLMAYGNAHSSPLGERITDQAGATMVYTIAAVGTVNVGDTIIATPETRTTPCGLVLDTASLITNTLVTGTRGSPPSTQGRLFTLGRTPRFVAYAVRRGNLTVCNYATSDCSAACTLLDGPTGTTAGGSCSVNWEPIADNVISLQAQYGRDTTVPADAVVDVYDQTMPTTACGWAAAKAVRLALVARNAQFNKTAVTTGAPTWAGTDVDATNPTAQPIDLSADANWQNYRYKLYETTVPLRNLSWLGVQTGC
jgi:type IV pilus assembly protein PilW